VTRAAAERGFKPTIVRLSKAEKELSNSTQALYLGRDCTLPQNRATSASFVPLPTPDQYAVWHFFYGTLADPDVLSRHLDLSYEPKYIDAQVDDGRIRTWAGKYKAMVDAPGEAVEGSACLVESRDQEDALRFYETDQYEVVRCRIKTLNGALDGLKFRFSGDIRNLD
jgi:hypothetical protein